MNGDHGLQSPPPMLIESATYEKCVLQYNYYNLASNQFFEKKIVIARSLYCHTRINICDRQT